MYRMIGADGREYGPISADQLRQWIGQGRADASTRVLAEGAAEWKPLASLPEFSMLFTAPQPPMRPTETAAAPAVFPSLAVPMAKTNGFAVAGLVLGIASITVGLCCCAGLPFSIPGLVFSFIALGQITSAPEHYNGKGMAITGIILSGVSLLLSVILFWAKMTGRFWETGAHHAYRL